MAVKDRECWRFLQWALPRMGYDPDGFRRVRGQVCKRISRRLRHIGVAGLDRYRKHLAASPDEWAALDGLCRITVTRFLRERPAFELLRCDVLPRLVRAAERTGRATLNAWSAGCGGGEEAYSLRILWDLDLAPRHPRTRLEIVATDSDATMLRRACEAIYQRGTLREIPESWIASAFEENDGQFRLRPEFRHDIDFRHQDIRGEMPEGPFDLVLCRYLAFTYFDRRGRELALRGIVDRLRPDGVLMIGARERPRADSAGIAPMHPKLGLWRRVP